MKTETFYFMIIKTVILYVNIFVLFYIADFRVFCWWFYFMKLKIASFLRVFLWINVFKEHDLLIFFTNMYLDISFTWFKNIETVKNAQW